MLENEIIHIKGAQKGDGQAFGLLYDHYMPKIYRFVYLKVSNDGTAEDLTHEVFLSAWKNLKTYTHREFPFSSWLYQIARNEVIDFYRTNKKNISLEDVDENSLKAPDKPSLDLKISLEKIKSLIPKLKPEQQDVIIMRFVEDLDHNEIAAAINKSVGAVRIIQHRALNLLKELYGRNN